MHEAPGVAEALTELGIGVERLTFEITALGGAIAVQRWSSAGGSPASESAVFSSAKV